LIVPFSILLLLIGAFLIVMKRRWADYPAIALLLLAMILHRPVFWFEYLNPDWSFMASIADVPFNYLFFPACAALIVFLVTQIKNDRYKIKLS
jgi:K+-sensing histidine kinase KdpD